MSLACERVDGNEAVALQPDSRSATLMIDLKDPVTGLFGGYGFLYGLAELLVQGVRPCEDLLAEFCEI